MPYVKVPANVFNGILVYLMSRPYSEVAEGITALQACQVVPDEPASSDEPIEAAKVEPTGQPS